MEPAEWLGSPLAQEVIPAPRVEPTAHVCTASSTGRGQPGRQIAGREPVRIKSRGRLERGIGSGDVVRLFNDRGACLPAR